MMRFYRTSKRDFSLGPDRYEGVFHGDLSRPGRALRPAYLVNDAGGVIEWGKWVARTASDAGVKVTAMVFDDGQYVTSRGKSGRISLGQAPTSLFDEMRFLANG